MYLLNFHYFPFMSLQHMFPLLWACKCQAINEILNNNESDTAFLNGAKILEEIYGISFLAQGLAHWAHCFHAKVVVNAHWRDKDDFEIILLHQALEDSV